jgi:formylglycine-generating enzyme required for sulfatase activity
MKKHGLLFVFLPFAIIACTNKMYFMGRRLYTPPGTVSFSDLNKCFFVDETEITNLDWAEYRYWCLRDTTRTSPYFADSNSFGVPEITTTNYRLNDSQRILQSNFLFYKKDSTLQYYYTYDTILCSSNWQYLFTDTLACAGPNCIGHPKENNFPIVGISQQQAALYCKWRSDRVFEALLDRHNYIRYNVNDPECKSFSREKYFFGKFSKFKYPKKLLVPFYRLPTPQEWEAFANLPPSRAQNRYLKKPKYKNKSIFNTMEAPKKLLDSGCFCNDAYLLSFTANSGLPNIAGIYGLCGNVAELTTAQHIAKGGSFMHSIDNCNPVKSQYYAQRAIWLGFRCVCELVTPEEYIRRKNAGYPW